MKTTCLQSIVAIVLKELRLERGFYQAQIADAINKTSSALAKIEMGQMTLSVEGLYAIASAHGVSGSQVLFASEHYARLLTVTHGWYISRNPPEFDHLVSAASVYYSSMEYRTRQFRGGSHGGMSILSIQQPWTSEVLQIPEVFQFAIAA